MKRYKEEERKEYVRKYKTSGKSAMKYSKENQIAASTLQRWIRNDKTVETQEFAEIKISEKFNPTTLKNILEVVRYI